MSKSSMINCATFESFKRNGVAGWEKTKIGFGLVTEDVM
jgi:hypothetical protein